MSECHAEMQAIAHISRELRQLLEDDTDPLERIETLLAERDRRLRQFFSSPVPAERRADVTTWIQELMAIDREAVQALTQRRQRLQEQHAVMRHQVRGVAEYQQTDDLEG